MAEPSCRGTGWKASAIKRHVSHKLTLNKARARAGLPFTSHRYSMTRRPQKWRRISAQAGQACLHHGLINRSAARRATYHPCSASDLSQTVSFHSVLGSVWASDGKLQHTSLKTLLSGKTTCRSLAARLLVSTRALICLLTTSCSRFTAQASRTLLAIAGYSFCRGLTAVLGRPRSARWATIF